MRKVVINKCYGRFNLSIQAIKEIATRKEPNTSLFFYKHQWDRTTRKMMYVPCDEETADTVSTNSKQPTQEDILDYTSIPRHDKDLVETVEKLGEKANGHYAELTVQTINDDDMYIIQEYDGLESILLKSSVESWGWQ